MDHILQNPAPLQQSPEPKSRLTTTSSLLSRSSAGRLPPAHTCRDLVAGRRVRQSRPSSEPEQRVERSGAEAKIATPSERWRHDRDDQWHLIGSLECHGSADVAITFNNRPRFPILAVSRRRRGKWAAGGPAKRPEQQRHASRPAAPLARHCLDALCIDMPNMDIRTRRRDDPCPSAVPRSVRRKGSMSG
jgi:hypothetical protein